MEKKRNLKQRLKIGKTIFFKDVKHAKWAILSVFAYFVLLRKFFITICPAVLITGLPCPGVAWRERLYIFCIWILRELGRCTHLYIFLWFLFCGSEYEDIYWEFLIQKKHGKFLPCLEYWWFCFISGGCSGIFPETRQWVIIMEMCYWICTILLKASYKSERWNKYLPELSKKILCVVNFVVICNKQCIYIF